MRRNIQIFVVLSALFSVFKVKCDPDPGPSPAADPRRQPGSAVAPVILRHPQSAIVTRTKSASLECRAEGYPSPRISWLKDGKPIKTNNLVHIFPSGELMLYSVVSSQQGTYQCVASNTKGTVKSRNATLQIAYIKEKFPIMPHDTLVFVGDLAQLNCEGPRGNPKPTIHWTKDGTRLEPDGVRIRVEKGNLVISAANKSDAGRYVCVAKNFANERESLTAILSVSEPPQFTNTPTDKTVIVGDELELVCHATGEPKPRISWEKTGGELSSRAAVLSNGNLHISNVQEEDEGEYVCKVNAIDKTIPAPPATVTVNKLSTFTHVPEDVTARVGDTIKIQCSAEGKPRPKMSWRVADGPVMFSGDSFRDNRIYIHSNGDMTIRNLKQSDQGKYTCEAINTHGTVSEDVQITVLPRETNLYPPVITRGTENMTVEFGTSVELSCTSNSVPNPVFQWFKFGSEELQTSGRFTVTTSGNLRIASIQSSDEGRYSCKATNDFGWSQWDTWIKVASRGSPSLTSPTDPTNLPSAPSVPTLVNSSSSSITVQWTADTSVSGYVVEYSCRPSEIRTWTKISKPTTLTTFTIRDLKELTDCVFIVRSQNQHGISDPSGVSATFSTKESSINTPDEKVQRQLSQISVRVTSIRSSTSSGGVVLEWDTPTACGDIIDGYKVYAQPVSSKSAEPIIKTTGCYANSVNFDDLESRVYYEIRVCAYKGNVNGRVSPIVLAHPPAADDQLQPPVLKADVMPSDDDDRSSCKFSWTPPANILPEYITEYTLRCYDDGNAKDAFDVTERVNSSQTSIILDKLPYGRSFSAYVTFSTQLGEGMQSKDVKFLVSENPIPGVTTDGTPDAMAGIVKNPAVLVGIAGCILLIIGIIVGVIVYKKHRRKKKGRGLPARSLGAFSSAQYSKAFTMVPSGTANNYSDGTGSSAGHPNGANMFITGAPPSMTRNTTVSLNNTNGNVGTTLSPNVRSAPRHGGSSFSYVTDQLTSMSNIHPQFSSPNVERPQTQMSVADLQHFQQQQYRHQISEATTTLADEFVPQQDLIDMTTPTRDDRYMPTEELPPPPPSPPMSQKTSLSDRTNRSRASSRSAERGSNHSNKGRRSRERSRAYQPLDRAPTDTDTGIDSPQQTPSPPRPADLGDDRHPASLPLKKRAPAHHQYIPHNTSRHYSNGMNSDYSRSSDQARHYTEGHSEVDLGQRANSGQRANYIPLPDEMRNSVTASSVSMMNRYDSESNCSERSASPTSSVDSLNMESVSQVGMNRTNASTYMPSQGSFNREPVAKHRHNNLQAPKKQYHNGQYANGQHDSKVNPHEQFLNRVNSASSSSSSSFHQNTADSGMSAGVGSYGHNSLNSNSSHDSGPNSQMSHNHAAGSLMVDKPTMDDSNLTHFPSVDRRYGTPNGDNESYVLRSKVPAPLQQKRNLGIGGKNPQSKNIQDGNLLPLRDSSAYIGYESDLPTESHVMLPGYHTNEDDIDPNQARTAFSAAKSFFSGPKNPRGRNQELSDVPEVSTSDFCEEFSDRSQ